MSQKKFKPLYLIITVLIAITAVVFFPSPNTEVRALDPTTYTATFVYGDQILDTRIVTAGGNLKESDLPIASKLPQLGENDMFLWRYSYEITPETLTTINYSLTDGDPSTDNVLISNINSNVTLYLIIQKDPTKQHKVTFKFPDGTQTTMTVYHGEDCEDPDYPLGFCEKVVYSASLKNVKEDMTIEVTVDQTMKYIFLIGCATALLASIVVIVIVILKVVNAPENDDDEDKITEETDTKKK